MPPRRTHTKSRTGCANCKRRKVKVCKSPTQPNLLPLTPSSSDANAAPSPTPSAHAALAAASEQIAPFPPHELMSKDFELLHHYTTVTAEAMCVRKEMTHVWRICIPRVGYQYPFVMHGVLAVSAAHKAYLMPNNRKTYLALSDYHQTVGSEGFRSELQNIRPEIGMPLFSFASVVVLYMYTLPSRSATGKLEDPIRNILEVIGLIRGIRTTLAPLIADVLRSEFAPLVYGVWPLEKFVPETLPSLENTVLPLDTWDAIQRLRVFQEEEVPSSSLEHYLELVDSLHRSAKLIALAGAYVECGAIFVWMYGIHESILMDIDSHRPHALVILAHTTVFLATTEKLYWFARGWARQVFNAIEAKLIGQPKFVNMLQWPKHNLANLYGL
ncbi:hypothetical protein BGZ63DRAFT_360577 [Mariannaea sp. PMI_226]|nr:hypothetical protein BGZ63DRAFT_360577 [Mariannaea sp. PMI_226]